LKMHAFEDQLRVFLLKKKIHLTVRTENSGWFSLGCTLYLLVVRTLVHFVCSTAGPSTVQAVLILAGRSLPYKVHE